MSGTYGDREGRFGRHGEAQTVQVDVYVNARGLVSVDGWILGRVQPTAAGWFAFVRGQAFPAYSREDAARLVVTVAAVEGAASHPAVAGYVEGASGDGLTDPEPSVPSTVVVSESDRHPPYGVVEGVPGV